MSGSCGVGGKLYSSLVNNSQVKGHITPPDLYWRRGGGLMREGREPSVNKKIGARGRRVRIKEI